MEQQLPLYRCHKEVRAAKIIAIEDGGALKLDALCGIEVTVTPGPAWMSRHNPEVGGYFVRYEGDGYESYSPALAFENGYAVV